MIAWLFLGIFSFLFLLGFSYIYVKAGISRLNYSINSIQNQNEQIDLENAKIKGTIAELRSLDRIEEIAGKELGMIKSASADYMVLSSTIVAEGKIRVEESDPADKQPNTNPIDAALRFLLDWINK